MRRGQQAFDEPLVGVRRLVGQEGVDGRGLRRQPQQIERQSADHGLLVGVGRKREVLRFQRGTEQGIDRRADPIGPGKLRDWRATNRLEAPERAIVGCDLRCGAQVGWFLLCGEGAGPNPALDDADLSGGHFLIARWHLARFEPIEQVALFGVARSDRRPGLPSLGHEPTQPQIEAPLADILTAVTVEAVGAENRAHVALEGGRGDRNRGVRPRGRFSLCRRSSERGDKNCRGHQRTHPC